MAETLSPDKQKWFDNLALRGAHEYAVELESENAALRDQLAAMERERNEALDQCTELHRRLAQVETRMRDACVSELLVMKAEHIARGDLPLGRKVFDEITKRLSSLTLDSVQKDQP